MVPLSVRLSPLHVCPSVRQAVEYFAEWSLCPSVCPSVTPTRLSVCPSVRPSTCHPYTSVRLSGRLLSTSLSGPSVCPSVTPYTSVRLSVSPSVHLSPQHVCPSVRQAVEYFAEWSLCLSVCHPYTSVRLSGRLLSTSLSGPSVRLTSSFYAYKPAFTTRSSLVTRRSGSANHCRR